MGIIEEVEAMGGMTKAIESGMAKLRIEESATRKQARIDAGEDVVVGVNKYRLPQDHGEAVDVLRIDNTTVLQSQIAGIQKMKAERDQKLVDAALEKLSAAAALSDADGNSNSVCMHCTEVYNAIHEAV